jgi:hypothetical protein
VKAADFKPWDELSRQEKLARIANADDLVRHYVLLDRAQSVYIDIMRAPNLTASRTRRAAPARSTRRPKDEAPSSSGRSSGAATRAPLPRGRRDAASFSGVLVGLALTSFLLGTFILAMVGGWTLIDAVFGSD